MKNGEKLIQRNLTPFRGKSKTQGNYHESI